MCPQVISSSRSQRVRAFPLASIFDATLFLAFSERLSTNYFDCPKAILSVNIPRGVASNQNIGNFYVLIFSESIREMFFRHQQNCGRADRGATPKFLQPHHFLPVPAFLLYIWRPGSFAVCDSRKVSTTLNRSFSANSRNSVSCASSDKTCLSSLFVDVQM